MANPVCVLCASVGCVLCTGHVGGCHQWLPVSGTICTAVANSMGAHPVAVVVCMGQ
jgi:hypothetical protein